MSETVTLACYWCSTTLTRTVRHLRRDGRTVCDMCRSLVTVGPDRLRALLNTPTPPKHSKPPKKT
jgi:hypothetical protein